ncbi:MAG: hypothetical protein IJH71_00885 [Eubacterium sp.]|nr:hypothetical protein [Eubacterium sp.]
MKPSHKLAVFAIIAFLILICTGLLCLINLGKDKRYRQGWIPFAAAAFCMIVYTGGMNWLKEICDFIGRYYPSVSAPSEPLSMSWAAIFNGAVFALYIIFKALVILFLKGPFKKADGPQFEETFYQFMADYNGRFLRDKFVNIRRIFKSLMFLYAAFFSVYIYRLLLYRPSEKMSAFLLPAVILIVVTEIFNYLNGYTHEEYRLVVGGDDSYGQSVNNYYKIREIYEVLFPDEILHAHTSCDFSNKSSVMDYLNHLSRDGDDMDQLVAEFFAMDQIGERKSYDVDMIQVVRDLLHRRNVVIFNPFYRDLSRYLILPVVDALISNQKILLITARNASKEDLTGWIAGMIRDYCKFESLWRVGELKSARSGLEVGIVSFHELYDIHMVDEQSEFFDKVGLVILMEPSLVVNTGQLGFSVVTDLIRNNGMDPVYCIVDRMTDGLVDTMSHLIRDRIVNVAAPPVPRQIYTSMGWNGDGDFRRQSLFDKQTRYLGSGFELAAVAIKNQIPSVSWVSEKESPIRDVKWIIGQYYTTLCKYMNLPVQQQSIYEKIDFVSNLWSLERKKNSFLIVEDEFNNIFSSSRAFLSRGEEQTFVNVMGENYLLRDYMRCNQTLFMTNPNAVPSIVADFARTERNVILKLLFIMTYRQVSETEVRNELELIDYPSGDALAALNCLVKRYTFAEEGLFEVSTVKRDRDLTGMETEYLYSVPMEKFERYLSKTLKNAFFVVENEDKEEEYIDAKLFSQVGQVLLPGQFVVYDGKYYQARHISLDNGVVLRRASDLYTGRKYYRQDRTYYMDYVHEEEPVSKRRIMDVETTVVRADFHVKTTGYLEMEASNDLRKARKIHIPMKRTVEELARKYHNKNILKIHLPETTQGQRFTICLLLSEMFRSIFPNTWPYLAVTAYMHDDVEGMLGETLYHLEGNVDEDYIYILEDSDIDLGLLETIDKNLIRFLEIMFDYVDWHFEKMRETAYKDPVVKSVVLPPDEKVKRRTGIGRLLERIARIFGGGRKKEEEIPAAAPVQEGPAPGPDQETQAEEPAVTPGEAEISPEQMPDSQPGDEPAEAAERVLGEEEAQEEMSDMPEIPVEEAEEEENLPEEEAAGDSEAPDPAQGEPSLQEADEIGNVDGTDIFAEEEDPIHEDYFEEHFEALGIGRTEPTRYQKECYLKFCFDRIDDRLELSRVRSYLNARGMGNSDLTRARKRDILKDSMLYMPGENCCDFCGMPITGVSYEHLNDGRIRCNDCSASAITTVEEFREVFFHTKMLMEGFYNIDYKVSIRVETTDAQTLARGAGMIFRPSVEFAARVLGYAQLYRGRYSLLVENGSPRLATIGTMVHEMTHIWQYLNWDNKEIIRRYGNGRNRDIVYEGMAMWAQIQYLYLIGETWHAMREEANTAAREDIYGIGFNLYREKYPISRDTSSIRLSPFHVFPPL